MEDRDIIELYRTRSERAIEETAKKYGAYGYSIAYRILASRQDSEECVNDGYLRLWDSIPPKAPENLATYFGKIVRNLALNRYEKLRAQKRGAGEAALVLEEVEPFASTQAEPEDAVYKIAFTDTINQFLASLSRENRVIFVKRYWYVQSVREIAADCSMSESKVKTSLFRSRKKLKKMMERDGLL